ncbi:Abi-alpha family protein [Skermania sp. ID1734]|uniref:Abi-alpha family protein n=1 Tax=Skermania sp. ID1734 TaxID=2597516 RepID=UPI00163D5CD9|nr:Abi-alpha family protein [Skermania sp. ID1734]
MTHATPDPDESTNPQAETPEPAELPKRPSTENEKHSSFAADLAKAGAASGTTDPMALAKLAGSSLLRAMGAFTKGSIDTAKEIAEEVSAGEPLSEIFDTRVEQVRHAAVSVLGLEDSTNGYEARAKRGTVDNLKNYGNGLIKKSWNPSSQPRGAHPSFAAILHELTPDEARILRFLAVSGPQPAIDIRTKTPFGVGSERLAGGINMIADMAGCAWPDRDQHYLANLNRLGLVRFSEEPVEDFRRYSLVEAQPKADAAKDKAKKAIAVYRSIYLSLFGKQFCETVFDLEGYNAGGWAHYDPGDHIIGKGTPVPKKKHH